MITIRSLSDLERYGIIPLTGEACGLNYRVLCDLTANGKRIVEKCLGVTIRSEAWNGGDAGDKHVASIMVATEMFTVLAAFALLETNCVECWTFKDDHVLGVERRDELDTARAMIQKHYKGQLVRKLAYSGTAGDRNTHVMTGRVQ